jgi:radical SAM protein with 4Fe4S-binding SPASM domain
MPLTVMPLGVRCNLQCGYCYEDPQRDAGNLGVRYGRTELERLKRSIVTHSRENEPFLLFGGEPLLLPKRVLEDLWAWGFERNGRNSVQTNGVLIDDEHIALFKRYRVSVGISMDGPGELNDARWNHTLERTRRSTAKSERAIEKMLANGQTPGMIVTLHRLNASPARLEKLIDWFHSLERLGIKRIHLHMLEVENEDAREKFALSTEEAVHVFRRLREAQQQLSALTLSLAEDLELLLQGRDSKTKCIWNACDPYTTKAVRGVDGQGERNKCSRVNKEGVDYITTEREGFERYMALYHTPQEAGGCQGCRFFLMCRGQCPGTAIAQDWRNRSEQCATWFAVFAEIEAELVAKGITPLSLRPERSEVEAELLQGWASGRNIHVETIMQRMRERRPTQTRQIQATAT